MAGFGYGNFGGFGGSTIRQEYEQERIGYGPRGFGIYEQDIDISRNPFTGATSVIRENDFIPFGGGNYGGYGFGGGYGYPFY